jgi:hypothetical protein
MNTSAFGALGAISFVPLLVMLVVVIPLGALLLCLAFRIMVGHMPSYPRAIGVMLLTLILSLIVSLVIALVWNTTSAFGWSALIKLVVQFLVGSAAIHYLLPTRDGRQIGYGQACLVQLIYLVMAVVLGVIVAVILGLLFVGLFAGTH